MLATLLLSDSPSALSRWRLFLVGRCSLKGGACYLRFLPTAQLRASGVRATQWSPSVVAFPTKCAVFCCNTPTTLTCEVIRGTQHTEQSCHWLVSISSDHNVGVSNAGQYLCISAELLWKLLKITRVQSRCIKYKVAIMYTETNYNFKTINLYYSPTSVTANQ